MGKIVSFMHTSLDGFVAGPKGEMDWIKVDDEIFDFAGNRTDNSDNALYGRVTWEMMDAYWPEAGDKPGASKHAKHHSAWYNKVNKTVLSRTMKNEKREKTRFIGDNVDTEIKKLKATTGKEIMIFGSPGATHSLMALNLVDELWLFVNPVLLGKGIPMFEGIKDIKQLKLLKSHQFSSGVVCLHHEFLQND